MARSKTLFLATLATFLAPAAADCSSCSGPDYTQYGSECCDTAWTDYEINCKTLQENYWDCSGCACAGDPSPPPPFPPSLPPPSTPPVAPLPPVLPPALTSPPSPLSTVGGPVMVESVTAVTTLNLNEADFDGWDSAPQQNSVVVGWINATAASHQVTPPQIVITDVDPGSVVVTYRVESLADETNTSWVDPVLALFDGDAAQITATLQSNGLNATVTSDPTVTVVVSGSSYTYVASDVAVGDYNAYVASLIPATTTDATLPPTANNNVAAAQTALGDGSSSTGIIVGIVVGLVVVAGLAAIAYYVWRERKKLRALEVGKGGPIPYSQGVAPKGNAPAA